jgi:hypothetical protein
MTSVAKCYPGLITNLGAEKWETETISPRDLDNWCVIYTSEIGVQGPVLMLIARHCDGDFFLHFLDSPEQGLLVIPLYSDIKVIVYYTRFKLSVFYKNVCVAPRRWNIHSGRQHRCDRTVVARSSSGNLSRTRTWREHV